MKLHINEVVSEDDIKFLGMKLKYYYGKGKDMPIYHLGDKGYILRQDKNIKDIYRVM